MTTSPEQPEQRYRNRRLPHDPRYAVKRTQRRREGRRRKRTNNLVVISWRDIPAQVNGGSGDTRAQRILPRRFHRAIDRAAMIAGKTQASQYVAEWRRVIVPCDSEDLERAALAAAAALEDAFPIERLNRFVKTGGWNPDRDESEGAVEPAVAAIQSANHTGAARDTAVHQSHTEPADQHDAHQSHTEPVGPPIQEDLP